MQAYVVDVHLKYLKSQTVFNWFLEDPDLQGNEDSKGVKQRVNVRWH